MPVTPHRRPDVSLSALLGLAWPIIVSRSTQVVIGLADAVMVADLGEAALAATTAGALNTFSILILPMGVVFIVSSFASQLFGRGDLPGARRYGYYGLAVAAATQVVCLGAIPWIPAVLDRLAYAEDVERLMSGYLTWRLLSGGAAIGIEALANYYGGLGRTRLPMVVNVIAMTINIIGNWVFIFGHLGVPALGVTGAAVASSLATWLAFLGFAALFVFEGERAGTRMPGFHGQELWRMLRFGVPSGLNWFFEFFAFIFFVNIVVAGLGTTALAALMAVFQIGSVAFMPAFALASAGAILVGQSIGADRRDDVPRTVWLTFLVAGGWQGVVAVVYLTMPELLMQPFTERGGDGALLTIGRRMLMFSAAWLLFDAAVGVLAEALRAAGDTAFTLWARLAIAWLIFVPGSYVTVRLLGMGDVTAVLWVVLYLALLAAVLAVRFWAGTWRRIELVGEAPVG